MGEYVEESLPEERLRLPDAIHTISVYGIALEIRRKKANRRNPASDVKEQVRGLKDTAPHPVLEDVDHIVEGWVREFLIRKIRADLRVHLYYPPRRLNAMPLSRGKISDPSGERIRHES